MPEKKIIKRNNQKKEDYLIKVCNLIKKIKNPTIIIIVLFVGLSLFLNGLLTYQDIVIRSQSLSDDFNGLYIYTSDSIEKINDLNIILREEPVKYMDGEYWIIVEVNITTKIQQDSAYIVFYVPGKLLYDTIYAIQNSSMSFINYSVEYDDENDISKIRFFFIYNNTINIIKFQSDISLEKRISYDQFEVCWLIENPFSMTELFKPVEVQKYYGIPLIENYRVQIITYKTIDMSESYPQPDFYHITEQNTNVYTWSFDNQESISSIKIILYEKILRYEKDNKIFISGVFLTAGLTLLISITLLLIDKYIFKKRE